MAMIKTNLDDQTSGLSYKTHYDRKNYAPSYDLTSGIADYDAGIVNYNASSINYDIESSIIQQPTMLASYIRHLQCNHCVESFLRQATGCSTYL